MKTSLFTKVKFFLLLCTIPLLITCEIGESILESDISETSDIPDISKSKIYKSPSTITLKVLLVEFSDIKHRNPVDHNKPEYTYDDFENMLFSSGVYVSPNKFSPDGEEVLGSLHDYYDIMSNGKLNINGCIINPDDDSDGIPDWITLKNTKAYYQNKLHTYFYNDATAMAEASELKINSLGTGIKLVIIYAGHMYREKTSGFRPCGLTPRASKGGNYYVMSEQYARFEPHNDEHSGRTFSHIGTHAHELAHLLGCSDYYDDKNKRDNKNWTLMSRGNFNGPNKKGACPAALNPYYRWKFGWIKLNTISGSTTKRLEYSLKYPQVFKLRYKENEFFLVEYRNFESNMNIGEYTVRDNNNNFFIRNLNKKEGILVWRKMVGNTLQLIHASGVWDDRNDDHIFPGTKNVTILTPWSDSRACGNNHLWLPNTKQSSNCGMEIISDEPGRFIVDLYEKFPERTSPSEPKNLKYEKGSNVNFSWEENGEPDIEYYKIYKKGSNDTEFKYFKITDNSRFIDNTELIGLPGYKNEYVYYYITASDTQNKESAPSQIIKFKVLSDNFIEKYSKTQNITNEL